MYKSLIKTNKLEQFALNAVGPTLKEIDKLQNLYRQSKHAYCHSPIQLQGLIPPNKDKLHTTSTTQPLSPELLAIVQLLLAPIEKENADAQLGHDTWPSFQLVDKALDQPHRY